MKSCPASSRMCDVNGNTMSAGIWETEHVGQLKPVTSQHEVIETQYCVCSPSTKWMYLNYPHWPQQAKPWRSPFRDQIYTKEEVYGAVLKLSRR